MSANAPVSLLPNDPKSRMIEPTPLTAFEVSLLLMRERVLTTELNWVREQLGKNPKRCENCGEPLR
jgi:hypothetical protein